MKSAVTAVVLFSAVLLAVATATKWEQIDGDLKGVTASVNYLWGVDESDEIYICSRPCTGKWDKVPGALMQVDADDTDVWGVYSSGSIWKRPVDGSGTKWQEVPGSLKHISASGNGYIWGVNIYDVIYKCKKPCSGDWKLVDGALKQIDGGYSYVYGVNSANEILGRPVDGSGEWRKIPGSMKYITGSGKDYVFGVNDADEVFRCRKPCTGKWKKMPGSLKQCDATFDALFGVNSENNILRKYTSI